MYAKIYCVWRNGAIHFFSKYHMENIGLPWGIDPIWSPSLWFHHLSDFFHFFIMDSYFSINTLWRLLCDQRILEISARMETTVGVSLSFIENVNIFLIFHCVAVHQKQLADVSFQNKKALVFFVTKVHWTTDVVAILRFTGDMYVDIPWSCRRS